MKRYLLPSAAAIILAGALGTLHSRAVVHAAAVIAPRFEVDPFWPKPLPNHWILGQTIGISADPQDHIWIIHRVSSLEAEQTTCHNHSAHLANVAHQHRRFWSSIRKAT